MVLTKTSYHCCRQLENEIHGKIVVENWIFSNENEKKEYKRPCNAQNSFKNVDTKGLARRHTFRSNVSKFKCMRLPFHRYYNPISILYAGELFTLCYVVYVCVFFVRPLAFDLHTKIFSCLFSYSMLILFP